MVKMGRKNKEGKKTSTLVNDGQKKLNVGSDITDSLLLSPTNTQTVSNCASSISAGSPAHSSDAQSDSVPILAYLKKIDTSNEALAKRVQDPEANRFTITPLNLLQCKRAHLPALPQAWVLRPQP